ncbi:MAG: FtsX-like permease family protein [Gemmatimonadota bacterium]
MFTLHLAWREARSSVRQIGVYMASITLGVAALVAIHSFRGDITRSVQQEARSILGADLRMGRSTPFSDSVRAVVDSLREGGARSAYVTTLASMVLNERTGTTRLVQVRGVESGFPFYGAVATQPAGAWARLGDDHTVLVDEAVLIQLDARIGDTVSVGRSRFTLAGTVAGLPTDVGFQAAVGPRLYLPADALPATGLLTFGSLARYEVYVRLPAGEDAASLDERYRELMREQNTRMVTADEQAEDLTEGTRILARFLALIGLAALLLGGIGVASAIHVYVQGKLSAVAVLRCLGARQRTVFSAYLLQAGLLGLGGAGAGVALGLALQRLLPRVVGDLLPVTIVPRLDVLAVSAGLLIGVWVALVFALIPLLAVRDVAPLQALRRDVEPNRRGGRGLAMAALVLSILALSVWQAPTPGVGVGFALGLALTLGLLWGTAWALVGSMRRFFPRRARYTVRQGVANLFRPHNQTVAITLALGFGVYLIGTVLFIEKSLQTQLSFDAGASRANVLLFDVQADQREGVAELVGRVAEGPVEVTPIVTARIAAVNGVLASELLADSSDAAPERWAVRRVYRNTYRSGGLTDAEELIAGTWWDTTAAAEHPSPERLPAVSVETDLAADLQVGLGDRITWDVQGRSIETEITSLRRVDWARFQTNFFVVFEPGVLEDAPQTLLALARVPDAAARSTMQRDLVRAFPNVSVLDLAQVQQTLDTILGTVSGAIRFLAGFSVLGGLLVLIGALATSRFQRMREGALLKTLGARRNQILGILTTEYVALGSLGAFAGLVLAALASAGVIHFVFEGPVVLSPRLALGVWAGATVLTVLVGMAGSRGVLSRTPLTVLREVAE